MAAPQSITVSKPVEYRDVPEFPGYRVGDDGTVWTCLARHYPGGRGVGVRYAIGDTWHQLKPSASASSRYPKVNLRRDGRNHSRSVAHLVLLAFVGPCPPGMQCCHYDDDPLNNYLSNLRWDTAEGNAADKDRNGTSPVGERNHKHKLTEADIPRVYEMRSQSMTHREIGDALGVSETAIENVIKGKTWTRVPRPAHLAGAIPAVVQRPRKYPPPRLWRRTGGTRWHITDPKTRKSIPLSTDRDAAERQRAALLVQWGITE